ncbi:transcription termination factor 2-like [Limulus polyphemus]|uniref:Transcription termination factor 2-like n=1 Tax=Limulus polyphemus TaxID=6850 RepID=A0ABM1SIU4_LIMPO|nr:transcription termination factor 2-like [Limulus polyphemus]
MIIGDLYATAELPIALLVFVILKLKHGTREWIYVTHGLRCLGEFFTDTDSCEFGLEEKEKLNDSNMKSVKCASHGKLCYLKTGTSDNNSKFGKSYYICPLRPECLFCEPADILPSLCTKHSGSVVELQCLKSTSSGEKRHYFRCKEGKEQGGLWCGYKNVKDLSKDEVSIK